LNKYDDLPIEWLSRIAVEIDAAEAMLFDSLPKSRRDNNAVDLAIAFGREHEYLEIHPVWNINEFGYPNRFARSSQNVDIEQKISSLFNILSVFRGFKITLT
jgi:hypothetical protein